LFDRLKAAAGTYNQNNNATEPMMRRRPLLLILAAVALLVTFAAGYFSASYWDRDVSDVSARSR
jgi:hypothetical protein